MKYVNERSTGSAFSDRPCSTSDTDGPISIIFGVGAAPKVIGRI
jgi:hypothetical protein